MVENFRCYIQHHALVWCLPKQFTQIYIMVFKNANRWYINFLKSFCHPRSRCWVHWSECEATLVSQRREGLASDRIRVPTFDVDRFVSRGSGDSFIIVASSSLWRPVPIGPIRSKSGVWSLDGLMLVQFQGMFRLAKIKLWERTGITYQNEECTSSVRIMEENQEIQP
jgi:hypothetical protein